MIEQKRILEGCVAQAIIATGRTGMPGGHFGLQQHRGVVRFDIAQFCHPFGGFPVLDFIKICFDFRTAFCVSAKFGSYAARNMFP